MSAKWIWHYRDFEMYFTKKTLLGREERGRIVPAFWEVPNVPSLVRFRKTVNLETEENIAIIAEGKFLFLLDNIRMPDKSSYQIPAGVHELECAVFNMTGMCALFVDGVSIISDESWYADLYDDVFEAVGTSLCCVDKTILPGNYTLPFRSITPVSDVMKNDERIVDFGKDTYVKLKLTNIAENAVIHIAYGESLEETYSDRCVIVDTVSCVRTAELPPRGFRFVRFWGETNFELECFYQYNPARDRSVYKGEKQLNDIYKISKYTLALCSRFFLLDGIKRDKWPWAGDAYTMSHMSFYSFFDTETIKRTILSLRGNREVKTPINNVLEYSFYWVLNIKVYYDYTGDFDFVKRNYEYMKLLMAFYIERAAWKGFIPKINSSWIVIDWHDIEKDGYSCAVQMLYGKALNVMEFFAGQMHLNEDKQYYRLLAEQVYKNVNEVFWSDTQNGYVSNYCDGKPSTQICHHQNCFGILFDYADDAKKEAIIENVYKNPAVKEITTPFFKFFQYEAMYQCGLTKEILTDIRSYWGKMTDIGAETVYEEFDPDITGVEQYAMYGEPFDKSLCHAWGTVPVYAVGRYMAGVAPTEPGYKSFQICPYTGDEDYQITVPILNGSVSVCKKQNHLSVKTDVSGGVIKIETRCVKAEPNKFYTFDV